MSQMKLNEEIIIPEGIKVIEDKKANSHSIFFPFKFLDEVSGLLIITRLEDKRWIPSQDIKSIVINHAFFE